MLSIRSDSIVAVALRIWGRRKWAASVTFSLCFVTAASLVLALPSLYVAKARLVVEQNGDVDSLGASAPRDDPTKRLQISRQQLLSRASLGSLLHQFNLYPALRKLPGDGVWLDRMRKDIRIEESDVLQKWGQDAVVVVDVSYQSWQPQLAADVTNTLAARLAQLDESNRVGQAARDVDFLKTQLDSTRDDVKQSEQSIEDFRNKYLGQLPEQESINLEKLRRLTDELRDNRENQMKLLNQKGNASDLASDAASGGSPRDLLSVMERRYNALRLTYTDEYPEVAHLKENIQQLKAKIASGEASSVASNGTPYQDQSSSEMGSLRNREQRLRDQIASLEAKLGTAPLMEDELKQKNRDYDAVRDRYFDLMKRYSEARLAESLEKQKGRGFRVLDTAQPPALPQSPSRLRLLAVVFMLSVAAAAGVTLLLEHIDDSFHSLRELKAFTKVPILATIPLVTTEADVRRRLHRTLAIVTMWAICCIVLGGMFHHFGHTAKQISWMVASI